MIHRRYSYPLPTLVNICPDGIFWTTIPAVTGVGVDAFYHDKPLPLSEAAQRKLGFDPRIAGLEEILCAPDCVFPK
jgi:hypothetical protein